MSEKELVTLQIDGLKVEAEKGQMLLPVALEYGFEIPHLCYHEAVSPYGACRLCLVEVTKGNRTRMTTSCNYPVDAGIEVATSTENVQRARRMIFELLLARAPHSENVRTMAQGAGVEETRFHILDKADECILCGLCERVCREVVGANAITFVNRGDRREVAPPFADPLACIACGACVYICPTDCIKMEEHGDERTIVRWKRTLKMQPCRSCGRPFAPLFQLNWIIDRAHLPKDFYALCPVCRKAKKG
ncbi:MAG: 2Fe-2S iron-sulfur cluster-binding protein [Desulfobacterales bacterium]|nr:2Fe-2S iron-sulfur cluster-binding protein [Desulfobacterales bacterium]